MKLRAKRDWHKRTKEEVFAAYGGYCCVCCGEVRKVFLAIDHVNNDGAEHRKKIGGPAYFYKWLKRNNFPPGFQVLCFNCNWAKAHGGCPHQTRHREMLKNLASVPLTY